MDPKLIELETKISMEQDAAKRTQLETELSEMNRKFNELKAQEQVHLARSQRWNAISKRARPGLIR